MAVYAFDNAWSEAEQRLCELEWLLDPGRQPLLQELGIAADWQCLEVGAGRGSIARWLADRVGPSGHVLAMDKKALRKRQVWVEPLFGEAKDWHQLRRFRLRGLDNVNMQGLLVAAGQNLKRWLAATKHGHRPAGELRGTALCLPPWPV